MPVHENTGKAVQILRINDDHSFLLNESQLEAILLDERVKDKPVAVVSVAGAYRQGKSFLLSFFLRYLRHNCRSTWLTETNEPMDGFEWSPGSKPHTTGILLWNEVFTVTTPQGEEVAVLLMDTQGSFDCNSTVKDCTTIFALSIMTSSVHVYNVLRNIQEDQLQHLQFFTEYGKLAQKEARKQPFQRLVFLVRDWAFPYEAEYGSRGGRLILKERLELREKQHADLQLLRRQILSCFSQMDCFLMPRPGDKVETDHKFDGQLEDIDPTFKEKLQDLVPWLLAPQNIEVKKINGEKITCQELVNYFRVYAKAFQSGHLPEPKNILQATADACNATALEKAVRHYMEGIEKRPRGNLEGLRGTHYRLLGEAKDLFAKSPKVGSEDASQVYLESLIKECEAHFNRTYRDEEIFLQREQEKEEQREMERELERQKEREWEIEREVVKEREKQQEYYRGAEREREHQIEMQREREEQHRKESEQKMQNEIDVLRAKVSVMEREEKFPVVCLLS